MEEADDSEPEVLSHRVNDGLSDSADRDSADPHRGRGPAVALADVAADAAAHHDALVALRLLLPAELPGRRGRRQPPRPGTDGTRVKII